MHPQIQQPDPGDCPICGMDLIPLLDDSSHDAGPRELSMSESSKALAEIQTSPVIRAHPEHQIHLVGQLDRAQSRVKSLTARFPARIDTLAVDAVGIPVERGQTLASVYSPELLSAQRELLAAYQRDPKSRLTQVARDKLLLWDVAPEQIQQVLESGTVHKQFEIKAPIQGIVVNKSVNEGDYLKTGQTLYTIADLSELWLNLEAYESDLVWLQNGQAVNFTVQAYPGESFSGSIQLIEPELRTATRTTPVRVVVPNPDNKLKPGMFAQARITATNTNNETAPLLIPASAVLRTGKRAVAYVEVPNKERPTYEGRTIELGPKADAFYIVKSGLKEKEHVVTHGAFKIDSALQIQAKTSMMSMPSEKPMTDSRIKFAWIKLLAPYLKLQATLAQDDLKGSQQILNEMMSITGHHGDAAELIHEMLAANTLDAIRRPHFETLSNYIIQAVEANPDQLKQALYKMHCPMVYPDRGADWLQETDQILNPYYGAMMLGCGEVQTSIDPK